MQGTNISNWKKSEIVKAWHYKCKHHHRGLSHIQCYLKDNNIKEKIGFLDIEATNLKANFGIMLSYCIKELDGPVIKNVITPKEIRSYKFDKRLLKDVAADCRKFDRLVTWYGSGFDMPFLRTRCLHYGISFPIRSEVIHNDLYMMARGKLCLHSKKLGVVSKFLDIPAKTHPLDLEGMWMKAMCGDKKALDYILTHNVEDVVSLEGVWKKLEEYIRITNTSI